MTEVTVTVDSAPIIIGGPTAPPITVDVSAGTPGPPGAEGPAGPAGPPGTAYLNAQWAFNQNTAVSPNSGTMRMNATTYEATTTLWVHETDRDGLSRVAGLDMAAPGDQIIMQSAQGRAVWTITAHVDSGVYRTFTVTLVESSGSRPAASSVTTLYFATAGATVEGIPAGGTTGQVLAKNSATDHDVGWVTGTVVVVEHGAVGTVARPAAAVVYWVGAATPVNALPYDFWRDV